MARRENWMPRRLANVLLMMQNVFLKIEGYKTILPLTDAQINRIKELCTIFIETYNYTEALSAGSSGTFEWRDEIFRGKPKGSTANPPPALVAYAPTEAATIGILEEFSEYRDVILAAANYTVAIGEDLMIVGAEMSKALAENTAPDLKVTTAAGFEVIITGSLKGFDAIRIEYAVAGNDTWHLAGFLTKLPGLIVITPQTPGQAEKGRIRGIFIQANANFGSYSPEYSVTLS